MTSVTLQDAGTFVNPKHVVGENSAGPLQTSIFPNYAAVPNRFGNDKVFSTDNMYAGTKSNIKAAGGKYVGGWRHRRKSSKRSNAGADSPHSRKKSSKKRSPHSRKTSSKKRSSSPKKKSSPHAASGECRYCDYGDEGEHKQSPSNLCKECQVYARSRGLLYGGTGKRLQTMGGSDQPESKITANGGTVGAGAPQIGTYQLQGQSAGKRRHRRKTNKKRRRKRGKTAKRKGRGRSRRVRRGGMGCRSKNNKHKRKGTKRKGTKRKGGCAHLLLHKTSHQSGGSGMQLEFAQGYGINEGSDTMFGATASPIPIKAYNSCGLIKPRN